MTISPTLLQLTFISTFPPFPFVEPVSSLPLPVLLLVLAISILQTMPKHLSYLAAARWILILPTSPLSLFPNSVLSPAAPQPFWYRWSLKATDSYHHQDKSSLCLCRPQFVVWYIVWIWYSCPLACRFHWLLWYLEHLRCNPLISSLSSALLALLLPISSSGGLSPVLPSSFDFQVAELLSAFILFPAGLGAVRFLSCPLFELVLVRLFVWILLISILEALWCGWLHPLFWGGCPWAPVAIAAELGPWPLLLLSLPPSVVGTRQSSILALVASLFAIA